MIRISLQKKKMKVNKQIFLIEEDTTIGKIQDDGQVHSKSKIKSIPAILALQTSVQPKQNFFVPRRDRFGKWT